MSVRRQDCDSDAEYERICAFDESLPEGGTMRIEEPTPEQAYDLGHEDRKTLMLNFTLSRRDQFAMAAMTGLLSEEAPGTAAGIPIWAEWAVKIADALIAALDGGAG